VNGTILRDGYSGISGSFTGDLYQVRITLQYD